MCTQHRRVNDKLQNHRRQRTRIVNQTESRESRNGSKAREEV